MRFSTIRVTDKGVSLAWTTKKADGETITHELTSPQEPLPALSNALAAFRRYVIDLVELSPEWVDDLIVYQLALNDQRDGRRNLVVSARRRCENANGRPLIITTPFVAEAGENTSEKIASLDDATVKLIAAAEKHATEYAEGKRAQTKLELQEDNDELEIPKGDSQPVERKRRRGKPKLVQDDWTESAPARIDSDDVQEVKAATEAGGAEPEEGFVGFVE